MKDTDKIHFLTPEAARTLGLRPSTVFGTPDFIDLVAGKASATLHAVNRERTVGLALGLRQDNVWHSPWSAPYASVDTAPGVTDGQVRDFGSDLREAMRANGCRMRFTAPPAAYTDPGHAFMEGFRCPDDEIITDTSFHCMLARYDTSGWRRDRLADLRKAQRNGLECRPATSLEQAYRLIEEHHHALGYNMAMTWQQVEETSRVVQVDSWIVTRGTEVLGAAYNYRVRPDVVQIINSGTTPEGRRVGAFTFLLDAMCRHYAEKLVQGCGYHQAMIDYGPSSAAGVQNEGLYDYKTAVGFTVTDKITVITRP